MRTITLTSVTVQVIEIKADGQPDGTATPAQIADALESAVGVALQVPTDPDRAPEMYLIGNITIDRSAAVIGDTQVPTTPEQIV
jgi:hypothetical protein